MEVIPQVLLPVLDRDGSETVTDAALSPSSGALEVLPNQDPGPEPKKNLLYVLHGVQIHFTVRV